GRTRGHRHTLQEEHHERDAQGPHGSRGRKKRSRAAVTESRRSSRRGWRLGAPAAQGSATEAAAPPRVRASGDSEKTSINCRRAAQGRRKRWVNFSGPALAEPRTHGLVREAETRIGGAGALSVRARVVGA